MLSFSLHAEHPIVGSFSCGPTGLRYMMLHAARRFGMRLPLHAALRLALMTARSLGGTPLGLLPLLCSKS